MTTLDARLGSNFRRLWAASTASNLADGVYRVTLLLVAARLTRSPALVAGVVVFARLPWLVCTLPMGALADRLDRRRIMVSAAAVRAVLLAAATVLALADLLSMPLLYAITLAAGVAEVAFDTTSQSILPMVVRRDQLGRANGRLFAAQQIANDFVGKALGGVLVGVAVAAAFLAPALLYGLAAIGLLSIAGRFRPVHSGSTTMRKDIAEGLRYVARHRLLRTLAAMSGTFNIATSASSAVLVLFAVGPDSPMGLPEEAFGLLLISSGAGGVTGSVLAETVAPRLGRIRAMVGGVLGGVAFVGVPLVTTNPYVFGAAWFAGGLLLAMSNVVAVSLRQSIVPDKLLGRLNAAYRLVSWGTMPLGAWLGGLIGEFAGLRAVFAFATACMLVQLVGFRVVNAAAIDAAEADTPAH